MDELRAWVLDDGRGFVFASAMGGASGGTGIASMHERAALIDGRLALLPWVQEFVDAVVDSEVREDTIVAIRPDVVFPDIVCVAQRRGGRPTIVGRNVLARTVAELVLAGEQADDVAQWYSITLEQVEQARAYVQAHPAAA